MSEASRLLRAIDLLHEASLDGLRWPDALSAVAALADADGGSIHVLDQATGRTGALLIGTHEAARSAWAEHYAGSPRPRPGLTSPVDAVLLDRELVASPPRTANAYLQDVALRRNFYGGMTTMIGRVTRDGGAVYGAVILSRDERRGDYGHDEAERVTHATPHLRRALEVGRRLAPVEGAFRAVEPMLERLPHAALLLDRRARVLLANAAARRLLSAQDGLAASNGVLRADTPDGTLVLSRYIAGVLRQTLEEAPLPELLLRRRSGSAPLSVLVVPLPRDDRWFVLSTDPAALVLVTDPEHRRGVNAARLRDLYGLTAAEARIATAVARGDGLPAAARVNGISIATAKTHLHHVFEKTGAKRQAQLAQLVAATATDNLTQ